MTDKLLSEDLGHRFIIGIDLGTTNSAIAYIDLFADSPEKGIRQIKNFDIPQLIAPAEIANRPVLPSFLYLPGAYDLPPGSTTLPWDINRRYMVGEFAREQGSKVSDRLVSSAKSWLSHSGVDRTASILPWISGVEEEKVSPVEASARYLQHLRETWDFLMSQGKEEWRFNEQLIVLTVPASFDEIARELTISAAEQAGIPRLILLEEPLATFYAWLSKHEQDWQFKMKDGQMILVCDVGGGTTDFSIIGIKEGKRGLRFNRLAVGDHLMLGGDNMDLALGRYVEVQLTGQSNKLDSGRWYELVHKCRQAKEHLLDPTNDLSKIDITITGAVGKIIANTLKTTLTKEKLKDIILDGFFKEVEFEEAPNEKRRTGLTEFGLPYVQDPAIMRHVSAFWRKYEKLLQEETGRSNPYPDFILFNGGVLFPELIRKQMQKTVKNWFREYEANDNFVQELDNPRPDLAVAIGAAYYGLVRFGEGVRVGSGSPRTYYVEVAGSKNINVKNVVCIVPRGSEEGFEMALEKPEIKVLTNQPVSFQMYSSSTRLGDGLGEIIQIVPPEITPLPPIRTVLKYGSKNIAQNIPVQIGIRLTEMGILELWCQAKNTSHRWKLQFDIRQQADTPETRIAYGETIDVDTIEAAKTEIIAAFRPREAQSFSLPENLPKKLGHILEINKDQWPTNVIRQFADSLLEINEGRKISAAHESRWLNLLGFCMRPGFGNPLDDWRMRHIWKVYLQGIYFSKQDQVRSEWWIFWRRVAGGLTAGKQQQIFQQIYPSLAGSQSHPAKYTKSRKKLHPHEETEIWMMLANFEWLTSDSKSELGDMLLKKISSSKPRSHELWAIGRFGSRIPFYGPLDRLVSIKNATAWLEILLNMNIKTSESFAHALVQIARWSGDRSRDVSEKLREEISNRLSQFIDGENYIELLLNPDSAAGKDQQDWVFGESLPAGLELF